MKIKGGSLALFEILFFISLENHVFFTSMKISSLFLLDDLNKYFLWNLKAKIYF